ncbi:unnamed protein product, partial [Meganyctiphanes norvegica]
FNMDTLPDFSDREKWTHEDLLKEIKKRDIEIKQLKGRLNEQSNFETLQKSLVTNLSTHVLPPLQELPISEIACGIGHEAVARYSRQLILPEFGPSGQHALCSSSVLIVGCGGLGCPAAIYLAAAGLGRIGLVDYDVVDKSNLHRQVLHTEDGVGISKSVSVKKAIQALNSTIEIIPYNIMLTSTTALDLISKYDLVLDCTDNVATRYLLNDACVLADKPLVSGSALRFEGQLTIYHCEDGPCYRCLFPKPPPPETVTNCSDGGVIGAVPGTIGCLQALEAIKILAETGTPLAQKMLMFDGLEGTFRTIKLRGKQPLCEVCGDNPTIKHLIDYEQFCGASANDKDNDISLLPKNRRISVEDYKALIDSKNQHLLIDVRMPVELEICSLPNTLNIPIKDLEKTTNINKVKMVLSNYKNKTIFCVCRRGNDSQRAVNILEKSLADIAYEIKDIIGGMTTWAHRIDPSFPIY